MSYTYGMKGAPAVGRGAPGLPTKSEVGEIRAFSTNPGPDWLICSGAVVAIADYPQLYEKAAGSLLGRINNNGDHGNAGTLLSLGADLNQTVLVGINGSTTARRSTNGGLTFANVTSVQSARFVFLGDGKWIAHNTTAVQYSSDNGVTWLSSSGLVSASTGGRSIGTDYAGNLICFQGDGTNVTTQKSTDYGQTWTAGGYSVGATRQGGGVAFAGAGVWVLGQINGNTANSILRSTDFGATVTSASTPFASVTSLDSDMNGTLVAVNNGVLIRSTDFGLTWTSLGVSAGGQPYNVKTNRKGFWIATGADNVSCSLSFDNGATWSIWAPDATAGGGQYVGFLRDGACSIKNGVTTVYRTFVSDGISFSVPSLSPQSLDGSAYYIKAR